MRQYTIKRIGLFIPTVILVTVLVFVLMRIIPGDPAVAILEDDGGGSYTQEDLKVHECPDQKGGIFTMTTNHLT